MYLNAYFFVDWFSDYLDERGNNFNLFIFSDIIGKAIGVSLATSLITTLVTLGVCFLIQKTSRKSQEEKLKREHAYRHHTKWCIHYCYDVMGAIGVSNHRPHDCLHNRSFGLRWKKTPKLCASGLCAGNSPVTGEFPAQMASNAKNVSIWWRHHEISRASPLQYRTWTFTLPPLPADVHGTDDINTIPCWNHGERAVIVRRAGLLWSQQDFEWLWSVPLSSASLY